jgi:hypothetical protein
MARHMLTHQPPAGIATLVGLHHHFDAERFRYLAAVLDEADRPHLAELARKWAEEHALLADRARREVSA